MKVKKDDPNFDKHRSHFRQDIRGERAGIHMNKFKILDIKRGEFTGLLSDLFIWIKLGDYQDKIR